MDFLNSLLYGIVQGLTEFLPVSSSAHLALLPHFLSLKDPGVFFDLSMHLGTALAVMIYFRRELIALIPRHGRVREWPPLMFNLALSCVATFIPVLIFKDIAEDWGRKPAIIAVNLIVFGVLFWWSDRRQRRLNGDADACGPDMTGSFKLTPALLLGLAQFVAIFPGVSRSGVTLTMGLLLGLSRERAVNYSFLMGLPVIVGGFVFKLREVQGAVDWTPVLVGMITSLIVGLLSIVLFLRVLRLFGAFPFFIYRLILGAVLLIITFS